jgi:septal ring-binding cell division protein DamX
MMDASMRSFLLRGAVVVALPFLMAGCERHPVQSHKPMYTVGCKNNPYLLKYGCSVDKIQEAAENGDPDAQYGLGYMYYYGIDTVRDKETAQLWIKRAADQGQPLAQKALSLMTSGAQFTDLHQAASGASTPSNAAGTGDDKPTPSNVIVHQQSDDVDKLNSGAPSEPITTHLPAYNPSSSKKTEVLDVLNGGSSGTNSASADPQPLTKTKAMASKIADPRLASNAKPVVANAVSQDTSAGAEVLAQSSDNAVPKMEKASDTQIASNDEGNFTMQLMASDKMSDLKAFAAGHQLSGKVSYYRTELHGKPWYMLTYGKYNSEKQATTALAQLPSDLKSYHPWVKSFATVEEEVRLNKVIA